MIDEKTLELLKKFRHDKGALHDAIVDEGGLLEEAAIDIRRAWKSGESNDMKRGWEKMNALLMSIKEAWKEDMWNNL